MESGTLSPRMRRKDASEYLKRVWGIKREPSTLAKLASVGGGPRFEHAGRVPLYTPAELDEWAGSLLSPMKSIISEGKVKR